jgi:hypothetical protein
VLDYGTAHGGVGDLGSSAGSGQFKFYFYSAQDDPQMFSKFFDRIYFFFCESLCLQKSKFRLKMSLSTNDDKLSWGKLVCKVSQLNSAKWEGEEF